MPKRRRGKAPPSSSPFSGMVTLKKRLRSADKPVGVAVPHPQKKSKQVRKISPSPSARSSSDNDHEHDDRKSVTLALSTDGDGDGDGDSDSDDSTPEPAASEASLDSGTTIVTKTEPVISIKPRILRRATTETVTLEGDYRVTRTVETVTTIETTVKTWMEPDAEAEGQVEEFEEEEKKEVEVKTETVSKEWCGGIFRTGMNRISEYSTISEETEELMTDETDDSKPRVKEEPE